MARSVTIEENHQRSDSIPICKSLGSLIRIDAISIDLAGAMESHQETKKCEHFSIRGYAAEMRKKDMSICLPFAFHGNQNKSEEQTSILPPLHVAKFRWWRCQNCLREIGATSTAEEIETVLDRCQSGCISSTACCHMQSLGDAAMALSVSQQAPELDNFVGKKTDVNPSTNLNRNQIPLSSCDYNKETNDEVGRAGNDVNLEILNPACDLRESNPHLIQERHSDVPDALGSKSIGLIEFCRSSCRNHPASDTKKLEHLGCSSSKIYQKGLLASIDGEQRIGLMGCETPKVVGRINEGMHVVNGQTSAFPSLEPEDHDKLSSESDEILAENSDHDPQIGNSSGSARQKNRKMRLLTELLGSKGNAEYGHIRNDCGPSREMPNISAQLDSVSGHMAVQAGNLKKCSGGPKGKRKMAQDDWKPLELICPSKPNKQARVFKVDADITGRSILIADSEPEKDARVNLQADVRSQSTQHRIEKNPMPSKRKNMQTQLEAGYSPLITQQEVVPKINRVKTGVAEKRFAAADGGSSKSAHNNTFITCGTEPYFSSSLSTQAAERKSIFCKKKNKQVGVGQACLLPQRNIILGQGSIMRKSLNIMETEPETVKLQSTHEATTRKGLGFSLNSNAFLNRNEKGGCIAQTGDGIDPLLLRQKGNPRADHFQRKDIFHVGESSVSRKSAPDLFFRKGLLCDLNEKVPAHRMSPLREMQNLVPRVENGSSSRHRQVDFSGTRNCENRIEVHEQGNDDIPMEIVELMARNQYERCHPETERNYFFSEQINGKRNAEMMGLSRIPGNGVLKSLQEDNRRMRKPPSSMGLVTTGENVGHIKRNPNNFSSEIHGNHFIMGPPERNSPFAGFSAFAHCQEMQSGGVQISDAGSIRNGNSQNCKWKGDILLASRFCPTNFPVSDVYKSCQSISRHSEEAEQVKSLPIPNHMPFGINIPQRYQTQSSNFEMHPKFPEALCKGRMTRDTDLNYLNLNGNNLEKQNRNFDSETFRRASAEYPFVCRHKGIDLNEKVSGSLDLHSNETIPAMQLLSLMDSGMQSSSAFSSDGKPKFFPKPLFPCDHHPKVSLDGTSKILEKPLFPYNHYSKEFSGRGMGVYNDGSRYPLLACYGRSHPSGKSSECSPAVPSFNSVLQNDGTFKRGSGFTGRVSSKSEERGKEVAQNRGRRLQKSVCASGTSLTSRESNPIQDKQKGFSGASHTMVFPLQHHIIEDSAKCIDLEANYMNGTVFPLRKNSKNEICSVNRNPADFTIPEAGNIYMISGEDLKFGKMISSKGESGLNKVDGRKRQRVTKHTAVKGHLQHAT